MLANVIAPFMFVTGARLLCANFVISLIEAQILTYFFKVRRRRLFGWLLLGNYFSAIVGGVILMILAEVAKEGFQPLLLHLRSYLITMFAIAFSMSFLMELPFVIAGGRGEPGGRRRSIIACAAAQLGSYAVLLPLWLLVTNVHWDGITPVNSLDFVSEKSAEVLFLSPNDASVYRVRLDGAPPEKLMDVVGRPPHTRPDDLTIFKAESAKRWDLWLTDGWNSHITNGTGSDILLRENIAQTFPKRDESSHFDESVDWRPDAPRDWTVQTASNAYAPHLGLKASNAATGENIHLVIDTPFVTWLSRCPTLLPNDQVVFELGGEIVVLDLKTRKLGLVARGHSPVVILSAKLTDTSPVSRPSP